MKSTASEPKRVVLDTNVLISTLLSPNGNPSDVVELVLRGVVENYTSAFILAEVEAVLRRERVRTRIQQEEEFVRKILDSSTFISRLSVTQITADPDDDHIIACALAANADYIISGDDHLLKIKQYNGIRMLSPKQFLEIINK